MKAHFSGLLSAHLFPAWLSRIIVPAVLWTLFVGFEYFVFSSWKEAPIVTWGFVVKDTVATVAGYYFFSKVVLPQFLLRRRWLLTALGLVAIYYCWALLSYAFYLGLDSAGLVSQNTYDYVHRLIDKGLWIGVFSWHGVSIGIHDFSVTVLPLVLLRFVQFLLVSSNQSLRLERENLNLTVNFLKAQINPHFLFNTLNNIYTMVVKQDERAPDMVEHLAHLLHYTVYESDAALVPLAKEIGFLAAYLELERLRYGQKVSIRYQQTGPDPADYRITPLLLFPFVENAFKHGVDSSLDASWVSISLTVQEDQLRFAVSNSFNPTAPERAFGGVGIGNVQKRLALHYAPQDYQLAITHDPEALTYRVALTIRLTPAATTAARPVLSSPIPAPAR